MTRLLLFLLILVPSVAAAELLIAVEYQHKGKRFSAQVLCDEGRPFHQKRTGKRVPLSSQVKKAKKAFQRSRTGKTKAKFQKQRALLRASESACREISAPGDSPPPPSPTPDPNEGLYLPNGDITTSGKIFLGIPLSLSANIFEGLERWQANCLGCHEERRKDTFAELRAAISQPPMYYTEPNLSDETLADIMAYVSRFRQMGL